MDFETMAVETGFLGSEFATWLWFCTEQGGDFDLGPIGVVTVQLGDDLRLTSEDCESQVTQLTRGAPAYSAEAKAALMVGKKLSRAKFTLTRGAGTSKEETHSVTIDSERFVLSAFLLPRIKADSLEERFVERMYAYQDGIEMFDALYREFLAVRLSELWEDELFAIRRWVAHKTIERH